MSIIEKNPKPSLVGMDGRPLDPFEAARGEILQTITGCLVSIQRADYAIILEGSQLRAALKKAQVAPEPDVLYFGIFSGLGWLLGVESCEVEDAQLCSRLRNYFRDRGNKIKTKKKH